MKKANKRQTPPPRRRAVFDMDLRNSIPERRMRPKQRMGLGRVELPTSRLSVRTNENLRCIRANTNDPSSVTVQVTAKTWLTALRHHLNSGVSRGLATLTALPALFAKAANWLQTAKTPPTLWSRFQTWVQSGPGYDAETARRRLDRHDGRDLTFAEKARLERIAGGGE